MSPMIRTADLVYERLRDDIVRLHLKPGEAFTEAQISAEYGVSRTPVREAITRLTAEGFVIMSSTRRVSVAPMPTLKVLELYEWREALESHAARLAAMSRDPAVFRALRDQFAAVDKSDRAWLELCYSLVDQFDDAIDDTIANSYMTRSMKEARRNLDRVRHFARMNTDRTWVAHHEHIQIIDAIVEGDGSFAAQLAKVHVRNSLAAVIDALDLDRDQACREDNTRRRERVADNWSSSVSARHKA